MVLTFYLKSVTDLNWIQDQPALAASLSTRSTLNKYQVTHLPSHQQVQAAGQQTAARPHPHQPGQQQAHVAGHPAPERPVDRRLKTCPPTHHIIQPQRHRHHRQLGPHAQQL